jgi:hypothetical protein
MEKKEIDMNKCVSCEYAAYHDYADLLLACDHADEDCKNAAEAELEIKLAECCEMKQKRLFKMDAKQCRNEVEEGICLEVVAEFFLQGLDEC